VTLQLLQTLWVRAERSNVRAVLYNSVSYAYHVIYRDPPFYKLLFIKCEKYIFLLPINYVPDDLFLEILGYLYANVNSQIE